MHHARGIGMAREIPASAASRGGEGGDGCRSGAHGAASGGISNRRRGSGVGGSSTSTSTSSTSRARAAEQGLDEGRRRHMRRGQSNPRCQASLEGLGRSVGEEEEAGPFFRFKFALRFSSLADRSRLVSESIEKCALPRSSTED